MWPKRLPLVLFAVGLCQPALGGEILSAYTEIDTQKSCSVFSSNEEGGEFANLACSGWNGYPVLIYSGDLRESVFYGFPPAGHPPWESFSAFNTAGPRIEWRIETDGSRAVAFATIHRWFVNADPDNPEKRTEVLVVSKVGSVDQRDGCVVGLVLATGNPGANEAARKIADDRAKSFVCGLDQRTVVGEPMPDFTRSE